MNPLGSMFVLSGEDLSLPFAEIRALVQTYSGRDKVELFGKRVAVSTITDPETANKISRRAAYCRFGGLIISRSSDLTSLAKEVDLDFANSEKSIAAASFSLSRQEFGDLGGEIKSKTHGIVSLSSPDFLFQVEHAGEEYLLAVSSYGYKKQSWRERRPRARRFFHPSAIFPKLARALVNLSRVREGELFLDPFCGTGSLLIESALMGVDSVGIDLTRWIARGSLLNLKKFKLDHNIVRADSTRGIPLERVNAVATDVPYGRASSTGGRGTGEIIKEFLSSIHGILRSTPSRRSYCVVMHPLGVELQSNSFQLVERHALYVHRNLTRAISILRKE